MSEKKKKKKKGEITGRDKPDKLHRAQEELLCVQQLGVVPRHVLVYVRLRQVAVALDIRDFQFEILFELNQASELAAEVSIDLVTQMFRAVLQSLAQPPINLVHLLGDRGAVRLQAQGVFLHQGQRVLQPVYTPAHLGTQGDSRFDKPEMQFRAKPTSCRVAIEISIMQMSRAWVNAFNYRYY